MSEKIPTWGYSDDGAAQIFDLDKGEKLPKGWHDAPVKPEHHPNHPDFGKAMAPYRELPPNDEPPAEPKRRGRPPKEVKHGDDA